jgi:hypothetical protein
MSNYPESEFSIDLKVSCILFVLPHCQPSQGSDAEHSHKANRAPLYSQVQSLFGVSQIYSYTYQIGRITNPLFASAILPCHQGTNLAVGAVQVYPGGQDR